MNKADKLYIPEKLRVGFQKRADTYNGTLAFIVYYKNGEIAKKASWDGWRDHKIKALDFDNVPTEGFVLNKRVGGSRSWYNFRDSYVRVYDPRGFEFEITIPNLLFILMEGSCSPGKGLEGKFVYSWNKDRLVLLPAHSEDYKRSMNYTDLQGKKVGAKELVPGVTYITRQQEELVYLGKFDYHFVVEYTQNYYYGRINSYDTDYYKRLGYDTTKEFNEPSKKDAKGVDKRFVFWNGKKKLLALTSVNSIAQAKDDTIHPEYADAVDKYNKSAHGSKVVKLFLKDVAAKKKDEYYGGEHWFFEDDDGSFVECNTYYGYNNRTGKDTSKPEYIQANARYYIDEKTGLFTKKCYNAQAYRPGVPKSNRDGKNEMKYREPTNLRLFAETENGSVIRVVAANNYHSVFDRKETNDGED